MLTLSQTHSAVSVQFSWCEVQKSEEKNELTVKDHRYFRINLIFSALIFSMENFEKKFLKRIKTN